MSITGLKERYDLSAVVISPKIIESTSQGEILTIITSQMAHRATVIKDILVEIDFSHTVELIPRSYEKIFNTQPKKTIWLNLNNQRVNGLNPEVDVISTISGKKVSFAFLRPGQE